MKSVYEIITARIVEQLERGTVPWRRTWNSETTPRNLISNRAYRGVNTMMLSCADYCSPFWLTYKQAQSLGGSVRKGEHGMPIVFWMIYDKIDSAKGEPVRLPVLRYTTAF